MNLSLHSSQALCDCSVIPSIWNLLPEDLFSNSIGLSETRFGSTLLLTPSFLILSLLYPFSLILNIHQVYSEEINWRLLVITTTSTDILSGGLFVDFILDFIMSLIFFCELQIHKFMTISWFCGCMCYRWRCFRWVNSVLVFFMFWVPSEGQWYMI